MTEKRVTRRLYLSLFNKSLAGDYLDVWVNAPRSVGAQYIRGVPRMLRLGFRFQRNSTEANATRYMEAQKAFDKVRFALCAQLWDVPLDDVRTIHTNNGALFDWCLNQSIVMIERFRRGDL